MSGYSATIRMKIVTAVSAAKIDNGMIVSSFEAGFAGKSISSLRPVGQVLPQSPILNRRLGRELLTPSPSRLWAAHCRSDQTSSP